MDMQIKDLRCQRIGPRADLSTLVFVPSATATGWVVPRAGKRRIDSRFEMSNVVTSINSITGVITIRAWNLIRTIINWLCYYAEKPPIRMIQDFRPVRSVKYRLYAARRIQRPEDDPLPA